MLRIVSMLMIVLLHVLGHGGVLDATKLFSIKYEIAWLLEIMALCAVNCYALVSGYVGVFSRYRYSNIVVLWLRVAFYSLGISLVFRAFSIADFNIKGAIIFLFPVLTNKYWYFTSYFLLFLLIPILNSAIQNLSKKRLRATLIILISFTSVLLPVFSIIHGGDIWLLNGGYSPLWLMILYLVGGYIRKYGFLAKIKTHWFLIMYFISALITWALNWIIQFTTVHHFGEVKHDDIVRSYISITILLSAIFLLLFFERVKLPQIGAKIVSFIAPLAFSVYLIHDNPLVREYIITDKFAWFADKSPIVMVLLILAAVVTIFGACIIIDFIRELLFKSLKLKQHINSLELKIKARILKNNQ